MSYDPIKDERKSFTLHEWAAEVKEAIDLFVHDQEETIIYKTNPYHGFTFTQWMSYFLRWISW
jgi:hypothetical protein